MYLGYNFATNSRYKFVQNIATLSTKLHRIEENLEYKIQEFHKNLKLVKFKTPIII